MDRVQFLNSLENLLRDVSPAEREAALEYYNDYFDDAGPEKEKEVIESLGLPERVAETIKKELEEHETGRTAQNISPEDRAVIKYDGIEQDKEQGTPEPKDIYQRRTPYSRAQSDAAASAEEARRQKDYRSRQEDQSQRQWQEQMQNRQSQQHSGQSAQTAATQNVSSESRKKTLSSVEIVLIVILCIFASPILLTLISAAAAILVGITATWLGVIVTLGVAAFVLLLLMMILLIPGIFGFVISPIGSLGAIGAALICGGIGLLFLLAAVWLAGKATPAVLRGIISVFRGRKGRKEKRV